MSPTLLLLSLAALEHRGLPAWHASPVARPLLTEADLLVLLRRGGQVPRCPHCGHARLQRWGRLGMRQRFRCHGCGRTFNEFTATALHRMKRKGLWPAYCRCIADGLTVRRSAARLGIHRDTAFRWRHRLLRQLRSMEGYPLGPTVSVGESLVYRRIWILLGLDESGRSAGVTTGRMRASPAHIVGIFRGRLELGATLTSLEGKYGAVARFARAAGLPWCARSPVDRRFDGRIEPVRILAFRFRRWLRKFRGVSEHYLDHYLAWFRLADGSLWRGVCRQAEAQKGEWVRGVGSPG